MRTRLPLVALLLLAASACGSSDDGGAVAAPTTATSSAGPQILIKNFAYNAITVAPGTTITVKNLDDAAHTVTSKQKGAFDVQAIESGTPKTFTAPAKAGTYEFGCSYHASMKGTLTVS